ncbi:kinase-like domain-containing protein [Mucidula mucida]|nr:kinase-like domain-containing protein [Mucidula mucida]
MLSAPPPLDLAFDNDEWSPQPRLYRAASVGSWGVTSIGRGFDWDENDDTSDLAFSHKETLHESPPQKETPRSSWVEPKTEFYTENHGRKTPIVESSQVMRPIINLTPTAPFITTTNITSEPSMYTPSSPAISASPLTAGISTPSSIRPSSLPRSPSQPRPRRRSSQQRVSLIAGRVSIAPMEPPSPPPLLPKSLHRVNSSSSLISMASSTRAPSPIQVNESFLGERNISEFHIEGEIGRGAYGLVKRAREIQKDGSFGPPLVIKQVIKQRILADCWKKHPKFGTIPIEIYVMSAISNTSYVLPSRRPWDPSRLRSCPDNTIKSPSDGDAADDWIEGQTVKGHPNICPLLDYFEDSHYYYLVLPSSTPEPSLITPSPPSDLFDLVESFPQGLPSSSIRTYLGQIADALAFLHLHGIVHRDVKDENVVLGPHGRCILIDFGSSGLIKKHGWDSFSGTLDYAGPEILRGERYQGKEQDVWAFGVVAYVLLAGECPFMTAAEAQDGLDSPFASASMALDERCAEGKESDGEEADGGGALGDAAALVRACLRLQVAARPTFEKILQCRFLAGHGGLEL